MAGSSLIIEEILFASGTCLGAASSGFEVKVISCGPVDLPQFLLLMIDTNSFSTLGGNGLEKDKQTVDC